MMATLVKDRRLNIEKINFSDLVIIRVADPMSASTASKFLPASKIPKSLHVAPRAPALAMSQMG